MAGMNEFMARLDVAALRDYIAECGRIEPYAKGAEFVREGRLCRQIGIVKSGYFKFVSLTSNGDEAVTGFSFEGEVVTDYPRSFMLGKPSLSTIVACCDAEVAQVSLAEAREYLQRVNPAFEKVTTEVLLTEAYQRYIDMHIKSPAERYQELIQRHDGVVGLLTLQEIASYLGISRRQLHRIKAAYD